MVGIDTGRRQLEDLLGVAGVVLDGTQPWDIQVDDPRLPQRLLLGGSLALGESYMDGWWQCRDLDGLLTRLLTAGLDRTQHPRWRLVLAGLKARLFNPQSRRRSFEVGRRHYDIGNDLYAAMLGRRMVYSCGYWRRAETLDDAQEAKLDLACRKLQLEPGMRLLDIGCGWGELLRFAVERHQVEGVGVTVSREQAEYARRLCQGLPITIHLCDYRDLDQAFDRIVSIGMFEHVGVRNYPVFFDRLRRSLPGDGLALLHTIGSNESATRTDPWIGTYIFPNSMLPSAAQIAGSVEGRLIIEDWHNFGADYDRTLRAWRDNIEAVWERLSVRYDQRFRRMWRYYLAASMALFRSRRGQLWQIMLSPDGVPGGYVAPR